MKELTSIKSIKSYGFLISYLTLAIYMLMRAIDALVYPGESEILSNSQQGIGGDLYFIELEHATSYIANSVLFPIALVIFYRLSSLTIIKTVYVVLFLHYVSVLAVSTYGISSTLQELDEANLYITQYQDDDGNLFEHRYGGYLTNKRGDNFNLETDDSMNFFLVDIQSEEKKKIHELPKIKLTFTEWFVALYSTVMSFLLVFGGTFCLPYLFRLPNQEATPPSNKSSASINNETPT